MKIRAQLNSQEIYEAIAVYIGNKTGISINPKDISVQVKSKQNFKSEWETADIRCDFEVAQ